MHTQKSFSSKRDVPPGAEVEARKVKYRLDTKAKYQNITLSTFQGILFVTLSHFIIIAGKGVKIKILILSPRVRKRSP